jgi:predicted nucleic acid-binding protein
VIVFCDTSALMKLYAAELHSDWTRQQVSTASHCVVSQITWVEMCAAFALKQRTQQVGASEAKAALKRLHAEWAIYVRTGIDVALLGLAGELALRFGLGAYDSVQLASAQQAQAQIGDAMAFCCFDKQLNAAAQALGMKLLQP